MFSWSISVRRTSSSPPSSNLKGPVGTRPRTRWAITSTGSRSSLTSWSMMTTRPLSSNSAEDWIRRSRTELPCSEMGRRISMTRTGGTKLQALCKSGTAIILIRKLFLSFGPSAPTRSSSPPPPNGPTPMDVDRTHEKGSLTVTCFLCRKTGHYARDCP